MIMRKFFLFALLTAATAVMADDAVLVENFSKVGNVATGTYTWTGDLCTWSVFQTARRAQDTIYDANQKQAIWMSVSNAGAAKVSTTNFEGGIKAVDFKYARYGSEKTAGRVLQLKVSVGDTEYNTPTYANNAMKQGSGGGKEHENYSHAFNIKSNEAQLSIENISTYTETLTASGICRICVGDITITPYLLYTKKEATFDKRIATSFTNADLINNIGEEGAPVFSISENTIGAAIDAATGEVTSEGAGVVTVSATWENITTSYELTILAKDVATAAFESEAIRVKINESVENIFTTNSTATVAYASSVPEVATVDPATGAVTLVGVGTTVITATVPENDDYTNAEASYTLRVVSEKFMTETFESATETSATYANPAESTTGDVCQWTAQLGGVKHMTDAAYSPIFGTTKYAIFRAPRQNEEIASYIESDSIEGGIESLTFYCNPTASEGTTTWDIRVFINDVQVGENYGGFGSAPQSEFTKITIPEIKVEGKFVIRFENHSTISGTYTSGNKGRLAIDNIEWEGYEAPCEPSYGIMVDGTDYIAGELNTEAQHTEYKIEATLTEGQTFVIYDHCAEVGFMANGQDTGGEGYSFTEDQDHYVVPQDGKYTIYLKMYGYNDNWIWTAREDIPTGIENQAVKADVRKMIEDGMVVIYRNGVRYNLQGKKF